MREHHFVKIEAVGIAHNTTSHVHAKAQTFTDLLGCYKLKFPTFRFFIPNK